MKTILMIAIMALSLISGFAQAADENALPALSGYDPVSYFAQKEPTRGSGMHAHRHKGQDYLFTSAENLAEFKKNPEKYMPQFGGYCAFGAAMGKKFHADPTVFSVVGDKLYLNLNKDIQMKWNEKQAQMIKDADMNWKSIKSKASDKL
tara:strand:- start:57971 stop:58417 length:447 start_codon:yes stop_codon:yes gene_type:complete